MCPKVKSDVHHTYRIEFQDTEREALNMVAASVTARNATQSVANLTAGVGNLVTPILSATPAGVAAVLGLIAWWEIRDLENEETNATFDAAFGKEPGWIAKVLAPLTAPEILREKYQATPEQQAQAQEERRGFRLKLNQFRNAIMTELMKVTGKIAD